MTGEQKIRIDRPFTLCKALWGLVVVVPLLLLTGCANLDTDVTFYKNERWEVEMKLYLLPSTVNLVGSELDSELAKAESEAQRSGDELSWHKESDESGGLTYYISRNGEGWQNLNEAVFDGDASISSDKSGKVSFSYYSPMGSNLGMSQYTLRLKGSEIVSSNADYVEDGTAIWHNPTGRIEAVIKPVSSFNVAIVASIAGGLACCLLITVITLAVVGGVLWRRRRK